MTQPTPGYLIARNKAKTEFFISSSAYDRPQWKAVTEATVYRSVELAERALSKLLKQGAYEARLVDLKEAISFEHPNGEVSTGRGKFAETPGGNEFPKDDAVGDMDAPKDDSEMTADDGIDSEVCPECEHEPCTCDEEFDDDSDEYDENDPPLCRACSGSGEGQYEGSRCMKCGGSGVEKSGGDTSDDYDDSFREDEESSFDPSAGFARGHKVTFKGKPHTVAKVTNGTASLIPDGTSGVVQAPVSQLTRVDEAEFKMPAKPQADAKPSETNTPAAKVDKVKFNEPSMSDEKFDQGGDNHDVKVKVPANVMSELKAAVDEAAKNAEFSNTRDDAKSSFLLTTAEALKTVLVCLELGTVDGIKQAQIAVQGMMSPIVNHIPASVIKFISMGGKKPTLKDLFDAKRSDKKES